MTTGIGVFFSIFWVCALNALQNSMMLRPRWPSAGPLDGDGFAAPAGTCNFRNPVTNFANTHTVSGADLDGWLTASPPTFWLYWPFGPRGYLVDHGGPVQPHADMNAGLSERAKPH